MKRLATGLGVLAAVLLLANLYFLRQNAALEMKVEMLSQDLAKAEARARTAALPAKVGKPGRGSARPARAGTARAERPAGGGGRRPPGIDPERLEEVRQNVRDRALDKMFEVVAATGDQRGWDDATISETQRILEDAFVATGALRAQARDGQLDVEEVMDETERIRQQREDDLYYLLGEEDSALLRRQMSPRKPRQER